MNLGYVFYRNDGGGTYSIGVTMPEAESDTFPQYEQNYALYNAPPGTWQKMSMYFYASPEPAKRRGKRRWRSRTNDVFKAFPATRRSSTTSISGSSTGCASAGSTRRSRI